MPPSRWCRRAKRMSLSDWSVRDAIQERVDKEDLLMWARKPNAPIANKPLPPKQECSETGKFVFGRSIEFR